MPLKHVILGNGAAGISAAEKLRQLDEKAQITVISIEDTPVYTKFMLPDYIGGKISKDRLILRNLKYYDENRINLMLETRVESINTKNKRIKLASGIDIEFDKLLVAVGGSPVVPNIEGLKDSNFFTINSIKDANNIKEKAVEGEKAVIVGAGLTGIETAFALKRLGMKVTLVERESRILPQQLDSVSADFLVEEIGRQGIELLLSKNVQRVDKDRVEFSDGGSREFAMLLITIGTRPNLDIIRDNGIKSDRGILVDEYMETSVKDVFAAGDVAEMVNKQTGGYVSSYIWPNALAQGKCAAFNMSGQPQEFSCENAVSNAVRLRDIAFISMGMINPDETEFESLVVSDKESNVYKKVVLKDNMVRGMIFVGDISSSNIAGEFIRKGTDVSDIKDMILDKDFAARYKELKST